MIKIALVDDHQMFLDGMVAILSQENNIEISFIEKTAKGALEKLNTTIPDLIISDISMPEMNGFEFIKIVKKKFPKIKVLIVSMFKSHQSFENVEGFLLKDSNSSEFISAINTIVNQNKKYFSTEKKADDDFIFNKSILSEREKDIIRLIADELTTDEIAEKLFLSKRTVETHRKNIFFKLQVKNIAGMIRKAIHLGIINS